MKQVRLVMLSLLIVLLCSLMSPAQQKVTTAANATVPPLIPFSNVATDEGGSSLSGVVNITFSLYTGAARRRATVDRDAEQYPTRSHRALLRATGHHQTERRTHNFVYHRRSPLAGRAHR